MPFDSIDNIFESLGNDPSQAPNPCHLQCPDSYDGHIPENFKGYQHPELSGIFHCGYDVILENCDPTPTAPQAECVYDHGKLVDDRHPFSDCKGTFNQYDSHQDFLHTVFDNGGILQAGGPAITDSAAHFIDSMMQSETHDQSQDMPDLNSHVTDDSEYHNF